MTLSEVPVHSMHDAPTRPLWVIGSGGFLGSAIVRYSESFGFTNFSARSIPWRDPALRLQSLTTNAQEFANFTKGAEALIVWAAGQGGVAAREDEGSSEFGSFSDFCTVMAELPELFGSSVVVCSSAGGVYGGSTSPPFTVATTPKPINAYGSEKIRIEELAADRLLPQYRLQVARITNLYGAWPGSRQGLVNRLCTAAVIREPLQIYVTLDTVRDYIDVADAAKILLAEVEHILRMHPGSSSETFIVGSGNAVSVGEVIATVTEVSRRRIPISFAESEYRDLQPKDLRVVPTWIKHGLSISPVELAVGVKRLIDSLVTQPRWTQ